MKKIIVLISILTLFQSCYFGMGLVEKKLPGNFILIANNSFEELEIIRYKDNSNSIIDIIINKTVFAVEYIIKTS